MKTAPMHHAPLLAIAISLAVAGPVGATGDASRGRDVLREHRCVSCHAIEPDASSAAPNLSRLASRGLNPASFTALLWNHAPSMWAALEERDIEAPQPSVQAMEDLFAYFYALRYFEPPGDAGRGKRVFSDKKCAECHPLDASQSPAAGAKPVSEWPSIGNPLARLEAIWNHAAGMSAEMERRDIRWPRFKPQEMADLWVFLRNRPDTASPEARGAFGEVADGRRVFRERGCEQCHTLGEHTPGKIDLKTVPDEERNWAAFAAAMWNHQPRLQRSGPSSGAAQPLEPGEMADLMAFLRDEQLFWPSGDPKRGARAFRNGRCADCHGEGSSGAPRLQGGDTPFTPERIASALWRHGPAMLESMEQRGMRWPELSGGQLSDLLAYINTQ